MSVHGELKHICPYCLAKFETHQGVKAHQKSKNHTTERRSEGADDRRKMRAYDHDRRKQLKSEPHG